MILILNLLAGTILLAYSLCVLNRMSHRSNHMFRLFYVLLGVGGLAVLTGPLYGYTQPQMGEVLLNSGMAGIVVASWFAKDRRVIQ
ncbi:hypothetical protein [Janthinobacterium sp. MDB2-8]|uniref:hypothetical protein n=1 Tax=Janthinobacterium sp. MDB2-8 TaxID=1259338 RepID=UPI003F29A50C